ncbi:MAG: hypothetical protein A2X12_09235 [Bacteroidetes bacterium GWE2_29_8]|nr:MAG: hypothetical protein A2X12_09235 [Bacteroidetes bacterium GWE2_29_8]OFY18067.1 MAG: hypothetical protein A2X02_05795 [Bacteroidetes bacterium GWF2_29_10]
MSGFNTFDEILDFAINNEQEAIDFYTELATNVNSLDMKKVFNEFAKEEVGHKSKLLFLKENKLFDPISKDLLNLKIADYIVNIKVTKDINYSDVLLLVMQKEKAAYKLYTVLANKATNDELKYIFTILAQEEAKHKLRFEIEYDEVVLKEN